MWSQGILIITNISVQLRKWIYSFQDKSKSICYHMIFPINFQPNIQNLLVAMGDNYLKGSVVGSH